VASAALAPLIMPIVIKETPAKRSFFIVLPQAVVTDAFRRSHGFIHPENYLSFWGQKKSIRFSASFHKY
jgi:hypothetical protein